MSAETELISELVRAANTTAALSPKHVGHLLDRAIEMIREVRGRVGIIPFPGKDALIYPRTVAAGADRVPEEEWKHALLHAAELLRDLRVIVDTGTVIKISPRPER